MTEAVVTFGTLIVIFLVVIGREVVRLRDRVSRIEGRFNGRR